MFINEATRERFNEAAIQGVRYTREYAFELVLDAPAEELYDIWLKEIWVGGGFPPGKISITLEAEGSGRGMEGSIRRIFGGIIREKILLTGAPDKSTKIPTMLYTVLSMPLPFHDYKALVQFIPQEGGKTLLKWNGKLAPKSWDAAWFGGMFCWMVCVFFRFAVGGLIDGLSKHVNKSKKLK